jgi:DNA repair photolyase
MMTLHDTSKQIREIQCKSILNRSRIESIDYTINPYTGCLHGCVYCYARFMTRYTNHSVPWGRFCDVKLNAPDVLQRQIVKAKKGLVSLSTVTDPYQVLEKKYAITRRILQILSDHQFPVSILTKSGLVVRDIDLLKQFDREYCEVGFSMATLDENIRQHFEPHAPPVSERIMALRRLHEEGIRTWVFLAPVLPYLTKQSLMELLNEIKESIDSLLVDTLNIKCGNWQTISGVLRKAYPDQIPNWISVFSSNESKRMYYQSLFETIAQLCDNYHLDVQFC